MSDVAYDFAVEVLRDGAVVGRAAASLASCTEDIAFRAVVCGEVANDGTVPPLAIEPVWHDSGPPVVAAVRISLADEIADLYGRDVFAPRARAVIADLVRQQRLAKGDAVAWRLVAAPRSQESTRRFRARASRAPYPLRPGSIAGAGPGTLSIVIDPGVLDAIRAAVTASPAVECAGLLMGDLLHDRERQAAALLVSGERALPPGSGGASGVHFAFGAETFGTARQALAAGAGDCAGWFHSHAPCPRCPENRACAADFVFFSLADLQVHTAAFPAAYMVALVAGKIATRPATDPGVRLYAWSRGAVVEVPLRAADAATAPRE